MNTKIDDLVTKRKFILEWLSKIDTSLLDAIKQWNFTCKGCRVTSPLHTWIVIKDNWYQPPRGCNEGDYYYQSGFQLVCPKCGVRHIPSTSQSVPFLNYGYSLSTICDRIYNRFCHKAFIGHTEYYTQPDSTDHLSYIDLKRKHNLHSFDVSVKI